MKIKAKRAKMVVVITFRGKAYISSFFYYSDVDPFVLKYCSKIKLQGRLIVNRLDVKGSLNWSKPKQKQLFFRYA